MSNKSQKKISKSGGASELALFLAPYLLALLGSLLPRIKIGRIIRPHNLRIWLENNSRILVQWYMRSPKGERVFVGTMLIILAAIFSYCSFLPFFILKNSTHGAEVVKSRGQNNYLAASAQASASQSVSLEVPILMYHRVSDSQMPGNDHSQVLTVLPANFEVQLAFLRANGYHSITFAELYTAMYQGKSLPNRPVIITFDDGYVDNYTDALPILKKYNFTATVFVRTDQIDQSDSYLSSSQLKEMEASGFKVEAHTRSHPHLSWLTSRVVRKELVTSKRRLENILGKSVYFLAYPYGDYNQMVAREAKSAGYLFSVTTQKGNIQNSAAPMELNRFYVGPYTTINQFQNLVR